MASTIFEKHSHIKTKVFQSNHRWTIDNFADYIYYYVSNNPQVVFSSPTNAQLQFRVTLLPNVVSENVTYVTLKLDITSCPKNRVNIQAKLSILDGKMNKCATKGTCW